jgi:hypothetical protein
MTPAPARPSASQIIRPATPQGAAPTLVDLLRASKVGRVYSEEKGVLAAAAIAAYGVDVDMIQARVLTKGDVTAMVNEFRAASEACVKLQCCSCLICPRSGKIDLRPFQILKLNDFFDDFQTQET